MKNIIVISHRRSGTHLTIDSIRNNFKDYKKHNFITLNEDIRNEDFKHKFFKLTDNNSVVIKTHFLPEFNIYNLDNETIIKLEKLFQNSHLIYVYRNGLDVMVSLYEYMKKFDENVLNSEFNDFIFTNNNFDETKQNYNRFEFWKEHIKSWQNSVYKNIYWIKYEDYIKNYENSLTDVSKALNIRKNEKLVDIRLQNISHKTVFNKIVNRLKGIQKTSVSARKGRIGDYKSYFSDESLKAFQDENKTFMKEIGY